MIDFVKVKRLADAQQMLADAGYLYSADTIDLGFTWKLKIQCALSGYFAIVFVHRRPFDEERGECRFYISDYETLVGKPYHEKFEANLTDNLSPVEVAKFFMEDKKIKRKDGRVEIGTR